MGGLRYLYATNNMNIEAAGANTVTYVTNTATAQRLVTLNLALLTAQSLTNDDATLETLYQGLVIVPGSTITSFSNVVTPNVSVYYTNYPTDPPGIPPHGVVVTNYTTNVVNIYTRQFANVVVWSNSCVSYVTIIGTNVTFPPFPIPGYLQTNTTTTTVLTNICEGAYYILPAADCGIYVLSNVLSTAVGLTNTVVVYTPTNAIVTNNPTGW